MLVGQLNSDWLGLPNILGVLPNCTVGGKLSHAGRIENRHAGPLISILVRLTNRLLAVDVALIVGQNQVWVVFH